MKEDRRHGNDLLPISCYHSYPEDSYFALDCHWHSEMEFFRILRGAVTIQCGAELFEAHAGDIAFFNSGELHAAVSTVNTQTFEFQAVVFSPDFLCGTTNDILRVKYISPVIDGEVRLPRHIKKGTPLHEEFSPLFDTVFTLLCEQPALYEISLKMNMLAAFRALFQNAQTISSAPRHSVTVSSMKKVIAYIQENYRSPLTIDALAKIADMSEGHFCRVFKQYTLKTPVQYINSVRLSYAAEQLISTNKRVLDIAMDCGFNSVSYFIEVFRESFTVTPSKYRKL